jgi:TetR/AcrR family transcriptional repressor of nem operon
VAKVIESALASAALDRAMKLFWTKGYYDTSIDALIAEAGLNRAAIYRRFGSKEGFFRALLEHYRGTVTALMLTPLRAPDAGLPAVRAFFLRLRAYGESEKSRRGCLMVMTASEVSTRERAIARVVLSFMDEVRGLFAAALARAVAAGELPPDVATDRQADYLLGALVGFMTMARSPLPRASVVHFVDEVLGQLDRLAAPGVPNKEKV